ncbi:glycosyltransferase family 4 protein [Echinicola sp. CAU 1574]|uniref:Glycosyltransferase family 4 protein n=1 Tax=Echinicola arenosa TaxID=2774144 RepID=A0ABR9AI91_9BACT|nr:glycosyltransferase family 4 protein [Echinicola arenosa]MBD8488229.1 glycosyltransferase family 4 protein [Echinicola arenosa]
MKIAILSSIAWRTPPKKYGPWEQVASNVCEGLLERGMDVTLFATADSLTKGKLQSTCAVPYEEDRAVDPKVAECLHISNLMEQAHQYDIIHNHFDFLPLTYSALIKTPMITTIHGFSSSKIIPVYKKYNATTAYVSISDADRSKELDYIATVYHGIDPLIFEFREVKEDYLLFFGRVHPEKGTHIAIEIAKRSNHRLIIAGLIQDQVYFNEKVKPFIDDDLVSYWGNLEQDKGKKLLAGAKALLHPINFEEPFGLSVIEAMMCGTPVIAFDRGSMKELIKDGKTGYLVKNIDEAIEKVGRLKSISSIDCRIHAISKFSIGAMVENYIATYEGVRK